MTATATRASSTATMLRAVQVLATLSVLSLLFQFVTAGTLFGRAEGLEETHATGAIVLHVLTGLTAIAAGLHWRATKGSIGPTVLAAGPDPPRSRQRRRELMTPVSNPARCSPPWKRACSTLRQRSITTVSLAASPRRASSSS